MIQLLKYVFFVVRPITTEENVTFYVSEKKNKRLFFKPNRISAVEISMKLLRKLKRKSQNKYTRLK